MPHKYRVVTDKGTFDVTVETPLEKANRTPLHEPSTYEGGFNKSVRETATQAGKGILDSFKQLNPLAKQLSKDEERQRIENDINHPAPRVGVGEFFKEWLNNPREQGKDLGDLGIVGAGAAASRVPVRKLVSSGLRLGADVVEHPAVNAGKALRAAGNAIKPKDNGGVSGLDRFMPNSSPNGEYVSADHVYNNPSIDLADKPVVDRFMPNQGGLDSRISGVEPPAAEYQPPDLAKTLEGMLTEQQKQDDLTSRMGGRGPVNSDPVATQLSPEAEAELRSSGNLQDHIVTGYNDEPQPSPVGTGSPHPGSPITTDLPDYLKAETLGSGEKSWHSGASPGSPEANSANFLHRYEGELLERLKHIFDKGEYQ